MKNDLLYQLALSQVAGIGPAATRKLVDHFGEAEAVFRAKPETLCKIPGIIPQAARDIARFSNFHNAEKEIKFLERHRINTILYTDKEYPARLRPYNTAPAILFYIGNADLNHTRIVSVVGTRSPSAYGKDLTDQLIKGIAASGTLIISGLAYGIDTAAHKACVRRQIPTIGVLAHGLNQIYPAENTCLAREMTKNGGLLTSYGITSKPDATNFPQRNKIIAAMCDTLVVVETATQGGSLITAKDAWTMRKKIFACPGRTTDIKSSGCNALISSGRAALLSSPTQILQALDDITPLPAAPKAIQTALFNIPPSNTRISDDQARLLDIMHSDPDKKEWTLDQLLVASAMPNSHLALTLVQLELDGHIQSLPGKKFRLNN